MKIICTLLSFAMFVALGIARETDSAPAAINANFGWCAEAKSVQDKLKRFEEFWKERHPKNEDEYDDQPHVTYVRKCAYRLASLYAQTGQKEKCLNMLKWLEKHDEAFPENA